MSAAASSTPAILPPPEVGGEGCTPLELATVASIMAVPNRQGPLPARITQLFAGKFKKFANLSEFVGSLHDHSVTQLEGLLSGVGVPADQLEAAFRFAIAPITRDGAGEEQARAMGWKRPLAGRRGVSLESIDGPPDPFTLEQKHGLAKIFWPGRPSLEADMIRNLPEGERADYFLVVWKGEGIVGFQRRAASESFDATTAWTAVVGACGTNLKRLNGIVQFAQHNGSALAAAAQPVVQRYFRVHGRQILPTTMFDPSIGAAKAARSRGKGTADDFPELSQLPPPPIPTEVVECLIPYLDPAGVRALMYSCRSLNGLLGDPNLPMWEAAVKKRFPAASELALQTADEWHAIFKLFCQLHFVDAAIGTCGQTEIKDILTARGQEDLPLTYQLWAAGQWDGIGAIEEVDSALGSLVLQGLWAQLVTLGAQLQPRARHAWWFTVGQKLRPLQVNDVVIRCDPRDYDTLREGIESRTDDERNKVLQVAATCFAAGEGLKQRYSDTSSLERQIAGLRRDFEGIAPVVEQLDREHDLIRADLQLKAEQRRAEALFATHPNLGICYKATAIKLEEVFFSAKAAAGGHVKAAEGALAKQATQVEFFGELIDFIPMSGALVHAASEGLKALDEARMTNLARNLSSRITTAEMLKQVEEMARWLTLTFEPQLRLLATEAETKAARGKKSRVTHKVKKRVTYERRLTPAESFAEFAVFCFFNRLRAAARGKLPLPDEPHSEIFVDVISSLRPRQQKTKGSDKGQKNADRALEKAKNAHVRLATDGKLSLRELMTQVGVETKGGARYEAQWTQAERLGHCRGTAEMAERRKLQCVRQGRTMAAAAAAAAESGTATELQRRLKHERRARKALTERLASLEARLPQDGA